MKETTRIVTVEITSIGDGEANRPDYTDLRGFEHELKDYLGADDVTVVRVQDFVMEKEHE